MVYVKGYFEVTDPCYVFEGDEYDDCCDNNDGSVIKLSTGKVINAYTCWGDGGYAYYDMEGNEVGIFSVDSGQQCLIQREKDSQRGLIYLEGDLQTDDGDFILIKNDGSKVVITDTSGRLYKEKELVDEDEEDTEIPW